MREQLIASPGRWCAYLAATLCVACGSPENPIGVAGAAGAAGAAGSGGAGGMAGAANQGVALTWDAGGFVAPDQNPFGIQGPFYFYSDCDPPSGLACSAPDASLTGPDGKPGWSVSGAAACIKGTAVKVESSMFSKQWGAGLALDLNSQGGELGMPAVKGSFDLSKASIRGFSVDISGSAPAGIRINLTLPGVTDSNFVDAKVPGTTTFDISSAKQGTWVTSKTPLDPTRVEAVQFQVFTNATSPTPYDFCVNAIRVIADSATKSAGGGAGGGGAGGSGAGGGGGASGGGGAGGG